MGHPLSEVKREHAGAGFLVLAVGGVAQIVLEIVDSLKGIVVTADHVFNTALLVDDVAGDHDQDLGAVQVGIGAAEESADERDLIEDRQGFEGVFAFFLDQTADDHGLAIVDRHVGLDLAGGELRRLRGAGDRDHGRSGEGLVDLQGDEVGAGDLRGDDQLDTGIFERRAGEQGAGAAGVGHRAAHVRRLFADVDRGFGVAGDEDLRAGNDFELAVAGHGAEVTDLVVRVVRIREHEGVAGLTAVDAVLVDVGAEAAPVRAHRHRFAAPAAGGRELETELRGVVECDFGDGDLQEDLRRDDVEAVKERLNGGVGSRSGTDDQAVQGAVGEDLHGRLEDVGLLVGRGRAVFGILAVAVVGVRVTGRAGAVHGLRAVAAVVVDGQRGTGHVVENRQSLHELLGLGVHDLVHEDAFLVEGDRTVEDLDPVADLLRGFFRGSAGDDELQTVDGGDLHGAGLLVVFIELSHNESEGRQDLAEFLGDLAGEDVLAGNNDARPLGPRVVIEDFQEVFEFADVVAIIAEEDGVRALNLDAGRGAAEERTDLVDDFLRAGELQRIEADFGFFEFGTLTEFVQREDAQQTGVFNGDRDAGVFDQGGESGPEVALRHRGVQVQGHEAADVGVDDKVESESVREGRDDVHHRGAVEHDVHGDLFVAAEAAFEFFIDEDGLIEGHGLLFGLFVLLGRKDRGLDRIDLVRRGEVTGLLAVGGDHFFLNGLREKLDVLALVLVMIKETEFGVRVVLVALAIVDLVGETDRGKEAGQPGGVTLFGGFDFLFGRGFDFVDLGARGVDDHDIPDLDLTVLAGRDDGSLFDCDLVGGRILEDHDLAVVFVLEYLSFAELFDCGGCRSFRLSGSGGFFRFVSRARDLG